jgi:hypothetical protein
MRPHDGFLGALDIVNVVPLRIRIDEIFLYDAGSRPMGRPLDDVMTTMGHSVRRWNTDDKGAKVYRDDFGKGGKEWILNGGIQAVLIYRFGFDTTAWIDEEIDLFIEPCRSPKGGQTYGIRIMPLDDELDHDVMHERLLAHLPFHPPQPPSEAEPTEPTDSGVRKPSYETAADWAK